MVKVALVVFGCTKLCIAGQVGASDMPLLSFFCFLPLPSCPSHPAPDGIIIVIILTPSLPLSLLHAVCRTQPLVPCTQRTGESKGERKGCREETVLLIKHLTEGEGRLSRLIRAVSPVLTLGQFLGGNRLMVVLGLVLLLEVIRL